ncbi:MAG: hypothetical protein H7338_22255, partial [Candidatus Sericytochromatia bacterium]|nr:hypothetical protein [Candidatus Sericytochromatia bacterium]
MKIRRKAPLIVISIAVLTAGLSTVSSYMSNKRMIDGAKQQELRTTATVIQNSITAQSNKAAARASLVVNLPSVQEAFRRRSRTDIAKRLVPAFLAQRDQYGVREGQFHLAPAFSFLRLFDLEAGHGEDLSAFREMVVTTNKTQIAQKGVEIGRRGLSIRGVAPVLDAQGAVGSFEVGMSFSTVLQDVKKTTGFEAAVFVDDAMMAKIATFIPRPDPERVIAGQQATEATNWQIIRAVAAPERLNKASAMAMYLPSVDGTEWGMVVVPVVDYKNTPIGSVVATRNFEEYQTQAQWALVSMLSLAFMQAVLLAGAMLIVINALVIGPMENISDKLALLFRAEPSPNLGDLTAADDEIGSMARNAEALEGFVTAKRRGSHTP